ncbi:histone deacetylase family protein [Zavarzinia sp. CC-PAN008]|uniref:histone deacetylase family protein n=1 Tax=Zavarzinia sp. CC-PAN008 TaxID=3243332 RepID=UPI003F74849E
METIFTTDHEGHADTFELIDGQMLPGFEMPRRAQIVIDRVRAVALGPISAPEPLGGAEAAKRVHAPAYVDFLATIHDRWRAHYGDRQALAFTFPCRNLHQKVPESLAGQLGYYAFDAGAPIVAGTFKAAVAAVDTALTGTQRIEGGATSVFSLCRPPGHHATADQAGGYCYLNNAAIAAETFARAGRRVAILDVDYHHGNGTQAIFYDRPDVLVVSLHGHPLDEYPYFAGYEDERGAGAGEGFNLNLPMRWGAAWDRYAEALETGCRRIAAFGADVLVVSLGLDTYKEDPISHFRLEHQDYLRMGERIAALRLPTHFVMEGGYAVEALGINTVNVLTAFQGA